MAAEKSTARSPSPGLSVSQEAPVAKMQRMVDNARCNFFREPVEIYHPSDKYQYRIHEALPNVPYFHPKTGKALDSIDIAASILADALTTTPGRDRELNALVDEFLEHRNVNFGETVRVAVVGDTGAGKSSFINAFLEHAELAAEGDSGSSCTQVVTEYVDDPASSTRYHAQVFLKPKDVVDEEIRDCFMDYIKYGVEDEQNDADEHEQAQLDEDEGLKTAKLKTAEDFLTQLFAQNSSFASEEALSTYMHALRPDQYAEKISKLQAVCERELRRRLSDPTKRIIDFKSSDLADITAKLREYSEHNPGWSGYWPIVETVRFSIDSPVLRSGFQIADCAGLSDTNMARRSATLRYLRSCSIIIVLATSDRIVTHPSTQSYLRTHIAQLDESRVILVPTKSDLIRQTPRGISMEERLRIDALDKELKRAANALLRAEAGTIEYQEAVVAEKKAEARLTGQRSLARSAAIIRSFQQKPVFGSRRTISKLRVIPVSSEVQTRYVNGIGAREPICLTPAEAGIATTRAVIAGMALSGRLHAIARHADVKMEHTVNKLQMAVNKTPSERIDSLLALVDRPLETSMSNFASYLTSLRQAFKSTVADPTTFQVLNDDSAWPQHVQQTVNGWKGKFNNARTLNAFARHLGVYKPSKHPVEYNWNLTLLSVPREDIFAMADALQDKLQTVKMEVRSDVFRSIETLREDLRGNGDVGGHSMGPFWANFEIHKASFSAALDSGLNKLVNDIRKEFDSLSSAIDVNPFNDSMEKIYRVIPKIKASGPPRKGYGVSMQRYDYLCRMVKRFKPGSPFFALKQSLEEGFEDVLKHHLQDLSQIIARPFDEFRQDLKLKFGFDKADCLTPEIRETFRDAVDAVMPEYRSTIKEALQYVREVGAWYNTMEKEEQQARSENVRFEEQQSQTGAE
ncbi:hypothetical protein K461DRAFT_265604 [Myriangium duriaei CBS 260.36]|uniref:G domain-containing protein n=1 Tax=Myriangium duriaei CBS 260.36 TaxID=1168546 RepID=A0A9P4MKE1_9PEZI|nr:hypothetical protein K461DRAFT_265604 [Myriangium duriaei CBS 260.36]